MSFSARGAFFNVSSDDDMRPDPVDGSSVRKISRSRSDLDLINFTRETLEKAAAKEQHDPSDPGRTAAFAPETLDLSCKKAKRLPVEVIDLIKERIERLALSHNDRIVIPPELSLCSRLFYLNLRWNKFDTFPEAVFGLPNLQTLDVSRNHITTIPESVKTMTNLKYLAFAHNNITRLPLALGEMPSLVKIKLDSNPIEYPPPSEFAVTSRSVEAEAAVQICKMVKKYLRQAVALQERQRQDSETEMSESNLETPRPAKRTAAGRFPVRPSLNGPDGDNPGSARLDGSFGIDPPPPIPQRSNARESLIVPPMRRPGLAPISTQGLSHRSRSETVASGSLRAKRLGYVPSRKMTGPTSASPAANDDNTFKPQHFRNASFSSIRGQPSSGADFSSDPVSPSDYPSNRPWVARSRLSSLPEDRRVSHVVSPTVRSARLLVYSFDQLNRPIDDAVRMIKSTSTPGKQTTIERLHYNATHNLRELDRQLHLLSPVTDSEDRDKNAHIRGVLKRSRSCLQTYGQVLGELRFNARKMIMCGDPMFVRALIMQLFASLLELRNACGIQETALRMPKAARISQATSDRTVTPTLTKSAPKRLRGTSSAVANHSYKTNESSIPQQSSFSANNSNGSNLLASKENIPPTPSTSGHATVILSHPHDRPSTESEDDRQFDKIYLNLRQVCDLADQTLSNCRMDLFVRKEEAARSLQGSAARAWTLALNKCDSLLHSLDLLKKRLQTVRVNDPANRTSKDFWHICDGFVRSWYDLASEMKSLGHQGIDIGGIKVALRPLQKVVKDVGHVLNHSPVYKGSLKPQTATPSSRQLPPTPLSAALGPAALATVPSTPGLPSPNDHSYSNSSGNGTNKNGKERERERERADTVMSRYGSRR